MDVPGSPVHPPVPPPIPHPAGTTIAASKRLDGDMAGVTVGDIDLGGLPSSPTEVVTMQKDKDCEGLWEPMPEWALPKSVEMGPVSPLAFAGDSSIEKVHCSPGDLEQAFNQRSLSASDKVFKVMAEKMPASVTREMNLKTFIERYGTGELEPLPVDMLPVAQRDNRESVAFVRVDGTHDYDLDAIFKNMLAVRQLQYPNERWAQKFHSVHVASSPRSCLHFCISIVCQCRRRRRSAPPSTRAHKIGKDRA